MFLTSNSTFSNLERDVTLCQSIQYSARRNMWLRHIETLYYTTYSLVKQCTLVNADRDSFLFPFLQIRDSGVIRDADAWNMRCRKLARKMKRRIQWSPERSTVKPRYLHVKGCRPRKVPSGMPRAMSVSLLDNK